MKVITHESKVINELHLITPVVNKPLVKKKHVWMITQKNIPRADRTDNSKRFLETIRKTSHFD